MICISIQVSQCNSDMIHIIYAIFYIFRFLTATSGSLSVFYKNDTYLHKFLCITISILMIVSQYIIIHGVLLHPFPMRDNFMVFIDKATTLYLPLQQCLSSSDLRANRYFKYQMWCCFLEKLCIYRKTSNISRTLVGNKIVDNSDVVGASPVGTAPTTSSFST